jgi:LacI family fructose operon transcriptional repressor
MPSTLKDVAERAGVSYATVSRVLANKPNIREETRQRVLQAVHEVGYRPNRVARSLRSQNSQIIGVVVSNIIYEFFAPLVRAIEDYVSQHDFGLVLCNSDESPQKEKRSVNLLVEENVAGVVIAPTIEENDALDQLLDAQIPVVTVDRRVKDCSGLDSVVIDNAKSAFQLIDHLITNGYRRIGAVLGSQSLYTARERYAGYKQALQFHDIPLDPAIVASDTPSPENGYALALALLKMSTPPTALFTSNHLLASGAFKAIKEVGFTLPDDIALVTFDNSTWTELVEPKLTVVEQPAAKLGYTAADLLIQRIANPDLPYQDILLEATIIVRGSSKPRTPNDRVERRSLHQP